MSSTKIVRASAWLAAARESPDAGLRLLAALPLEARGEVLRRWCAVPLGDPSERSRPGLRKCAATTRKTGLGAQLEAFARTIRRVG